MKKIWIVGAKGQLGLALHNIYKETPNALLETDYQEVDITDLESVLAYAGANNPDVIINCAALTAVDLCETERDKAYLVNSLGPRNLAIAATKVDAELVQVSTDYVFDGNNTKPYCEFDETHPQSVYGSSKLAGENFVKEMCQRFYIVRTAWLYGDGQNFVKTMFRLADTGNPIRVVDDQLGSPTSATELAKMISALIETGEYGTYHGTCEGSCSWYEFAKEIFELSKRDVELLAIPTSEYVTPTKRPAYSVLNNYMLTLTNIYKMPHWKTALVEYMNDGGTL